LSVRTGRSTSTVVFPVSVTVWLTAAKHRSGEETLSVYWPCGAVMLYAPAASVTSLSGVPARVTFAPATGEPPAVTVPLSTASGAAVRDRSKTAAPPSVTVTLPVASANPNLLAVTT
jgi:hypothetical protein